MEPSRRGRRKRRVVQDLTARFPGRGACLVIVLTNDPHRLPRLGCSRGVNLRDVVIALSWLGRGDYAADWEEAP
jgi:hypothetical protein